MDDETIKLSETAGYVIPVNSEVVVSNAITFEQDGKIVAQVSATYDTKDLPPELHHLFFQLASQACQTLVLPRSDYIPVEYVPPPLPWYSRFYRWLAKLW